MNNKMLAFIFSALLFVPGMAFAAGEKATITSPVNGATVGSNDKVKVSYEAVPGPDGDHLHLYVDGKRVDVLRQMKGSTEVGALPPGKHHICLAVNTKGHVPVGTAGCVDVTSN